jgi:outer membrane protein assembly factor BamB
LLVSTLFLSSAVLARAEVSSWPTWRGTTGTGSAPSGAKPPVKWSEQDIKWKSKIPGLGYSTPIVWKDRIYLLTAIETTEAAAAPDTSSAPAPADRPPSGPPKGGKKGGKGPGGGGGGFGGGPAPTKIHEFAVVALDRSTGKIAWQKTARREMPHEGRHPTNTFASASPLTDGEHLYVPFGSRGFYCYDLQGNLKWEKDLGDMRTKLGFGEGSSPALAGELLIINWDHESGSYIVALNKHTGAEVWRTPREDSTSWSTPLIVEHEGRTQAVVAASKMTRSYDAKTGELLWEASGLGANVIPMPVTSNGIVYVTSGYTRPAIQAIKLSSRGDISDTNNIIWNVRQNGPYVASPVLSGDRLYVTRERKGNLSCLNARTGEFHFQDKELPGIRDIYASPLLANGHLYIAGRDGTIVVVKDSPDFEVVSTTELGEGIDASPVALDNQLFLRGHEFLYCISES